MRVTNTVCWIWGLFSRDEWKEKDKYRRTLGHIYIDDRWINKEMIEEGWAWHYKQYSDDYKLAAAEKTARATKAGLWQEPKPIAPWDYRHNPSLAENMATTDTDTKQPATHGTAIYVTRTGSKYHRAGCRYLTKSRIPTSLNDVLGRYTPCSVCNPPLASSHSHTNPSATPFVSAATDTDAKGVTVYVTRTGKKYHRAGCRYLHSSIPKSLEDAKGRYSPCSVCNPPL